MDTRNYRTDDLIDDALRRDDDCLESLYHIK